MIHCRLPKYCNNEIKYSVRYVLNRILDCEISFKKSEIDFIELIFDNNQKLTFSADFFKKSNADWLGNTSLADECLIFNCTDFISHQFNSLPVIYGTPTLSNNENGIDCGIDVFGTIFFLLSRYEEAIDEVQLDIHNRFPATGSLAYKFGFLERPIVDEYIIFIGFLIRGLSTEFKLKQSSFRKVITCDVDLPFDPIRRSLKLTMRSSIGDLIKRIAPFSAFKKWIAFACNKLSIPYLDCFRYKISWIMDENEIAGNIVAFYFITECTEPRFDYDFDFESSEMRQLLREIYTRGHEIGLHPGYNCFNSPELFKKSADTLKRVLSEEGIKQPLLGGRMHYLRWNASITPKLWEDNGFDYDSTLSFADKAGFRCGTCHSFPMYDLIGRSALKVTQRPLINMECTIIAPSYENLGYSDEAKARFHYFKNIVKENNGEYVLLWHNSHFKTQNDKDIYSELIV